MLTRAVVLALQIKRCSVSALLSILLWIWLASGACHLCALYLSALLPPLHLQPHLLPIADQLHPAHLIHVQPVLPLASLRGDDRQRLELPPSRFARLFQIPPRQHQQRRLQRFVVSRSSPTHTPGHQHAQAAVFEQHGGAVLVDAPGPAVRAPSPRSKTCPAAGAWMTAPCRRSSRLRARGCAGRGSPAAPARR
jgi:hypothetical protein